MKSMTGFGAAKAKHPFKIQVNIRSVNGRYLDIKFHMGREFIELESQFKKRLSTLVQRGTVDIYINTPKEEYLTKNVKLDKKYISELISEYKKVSKDLSMDSSELSLSSFLGLPGVLEFNESYSVGSSAKKELLATFELALKKMLQEREREGRSLKKTLTSYYAQLLNYVRQIKSKRKQLNAELEAKLKSRLQKKTIEEIDPARLGQEMIYYLDKSDITEEIIRLEEHIKTCQNLLKSGESIGKKLDFFCQELLREVNTVGSKSGSSELTRLVVDAKSLVESIREQVQNIE